MLPAKGRGAVRSATAVLAAIVVAGCGADRALTRARGLAARGDVDAAISALDRRIVSDPADVDAHRMRAVLLSRAGRPGAALRELALLHKNRDLDAAERRRLGALYLERARRRLRLGDGAAYRDLERARALGAPAAPALARSLYRAAALAAYRIGDPAGRAAGARLLRVAASYATGPRALVAGFSAHAVLADLGAAGRWLWDGGADRAGFDLLARYVHRGGRDPQLLSRWLAAYAWWHGTAARPPLLLLDQVRAAGVDLCRIARSPAALECGEDLPRLAANAAAAARVSARAQLLFWRTADPAQAAAWVLITLRARLSGGPPWLAALTRRVDVDRLEGGGGGAVPAFAAATLWRAAGRAAQADAALARAIESAPALSPAERAVVIAEAGAEGRGDQTIRQLLAAGPTSELGWRAALAAERAGGRAAAEGAVLARAPPAVARAYLLRAGDLGPLVAGRHPPAGEVATLSRWWRLLAAPPLAVGRKAALARWQILRPGLQASAWSAARAEPVGVPDPIAVPGGHPRWERALREIVRAFRHDPARADRLARRFVDGDVAAGARGPAVAELFAALGDPARALKWRLAVLASSPGRPRYLFAAADAEATVGHFAAAKVLFTRAEAASGDPGATSLRAAERLLLHGAPVPALVQARRAVSLMAPGERRPALELVARTLIAVGRRRRAAAVLAQMIREVAPAFRDAARARAQTLWGRQRLPPRLAGRVWRGRRDRLLAAAGRDPRGSRERIEAALALAPDDPALAETLSRIPAAPPGPAKNLAASAGGGATASAMPAESERRRLESALDTAIAWAPGDVGARAALLDMTDPSQPGYARTVARLLLVGLAGRGERAARALEAAAKGCERLGAPVAARAIRREAAIRRAGDRLTKAARSPRTPYAPRRTPGQ